MKNLKICLVAAMSLFGLAAQAQKTQAPKFGKGLFQLQGEDNSWSMKIGARMQFLTTNSWSIDGDGNYGKSATEMMIRRARLKFGGHAFTPKLKYKIELGLSNKDIGGASELTNNAPRYILDAVAKWNFYENFELWAGQTKLPGNRERVVSSGNLQFVNRSRLNSLFNIDRDLGLQLRHHAKLGENFIIREAFAFSQGEGRNVVKKNIGGNEYTGRVEMLPFGKFEGKGDYFGTDLKREQTPKLSIGATYNYNDGGEVANSLGTVFVDAMFKYKGFSFMGEYANRKAKDVEGNILEGNTSVEEDLGAFNGNLKKQYSKGIYMISGNAINTQAGYLFKNNIEVAARYTSTGLEGFKIRENEVTLGVSKYIVGHKLKVQSDITRRSYSGIDGDNGKLQYRLQFDLHF